MKIILYDVVLHDGITGYEGLVTYLIETNIS